ncbi:MAG: OmpH family outer membrane protein [Bacteroidetes bacterium]|nr:MAG: OmpH family outer membrane protein [Bacteroidota bacterium]
MKKSIVTVILAVVFTIPAFSQKNAYVDTEYILSKIPAYENAQTKLNEYSKVWQKEVEAKYKEVDNKYKNYQTEIALLSAEMKKQREDEIINLEKEANDLKEKYFGNEGELFNKRKELVKPIQDEVYNAIKEIATEGNYGFIFDKSADMSLIYTDPKFDISDDILKKLGY